MGLRKLAKQQILLIIGGGIAAYKCLDLVRRIKEQGLGVRAVLTDAGQNFVTPLSVSALTGEKVLTDLFDLDDESEIGHIRLSRQCDLIVVAPATADLIAKMAGGHANDLASAVLLATDKPVLVFPAMNPHMWHHPATRRNVSQLCQDGVLVVDPSVGEMAESGEAGQGRLPEVTDILAEIKKGLARRGGTLTKQTDHSLAGRHVLVTSGPTHEPIDPVRYIANRSSGKQGHAIAAAAARAGARTTLISGPAQVSDPPGVRTVKVETGEQMLAAVLDNLPADIAIFTAAVADWRVENVKANKIKKGKDGKSPKFELVENTDILETVGRSRKNRPQLVIGFAAETRNVIASAQKKRKDKFADWIIANDVSPETGIMGGNNNMVHIVDSDGVESWEEMRKDDVAEKIIQRAARYLAARKRVSS